uniref:GCR080 n=1 Tax=Schmidtea mediterranea TaxID=79327 RepID=A0A193KUA9_SCHMD|nr:GCR080 [Schmidtea mediterranea]
MSLDYQMVKRNFQIIFNPDSNISILTRAYNELMKHLNDDSIRNESEKLKALLHSKYESKVGAFKLSNQVYYLVAIWILICVTGVVSNLVVIITLWRNPCKLIYEIFCIGLAFTDIGFLLLAVPLTSVHYLLLNWILGSFMCKLINYLIQSVVFSSSLILVGLTFSRFIAVLHPWKNRRMTLNGAKWACIIGWFIGFSISTPYFYYHDTEKSDSWMRFITRNRTNQFVNNPYKCRLEFPSNESRYIVIIGLLNTSYLIPFIGILIMNAMVVCYVQKECLKEKGTKKEIKKEVKFPEHYRDSLISNDIVNKVKASKLFRRRQMQKRVTNLVLLVTSVYGLCWLPINIINAWYNLSPASFPSTPAMEYVRYVSQTLSFCSACVNPIVYSIASKAFKSAFIDRFPFLKNFTLHRKHSPKTEIILTIN